MTAVRARAGILVILTVVSFGLLAGTGWAGRPSRALEAALEDSTFSVAERSAIATSWGSARRAGISERDLRGAVEACLDGNFDARQVGRVLGLLAKVELAGLPWEGFLSKIEEGVSKRVDPEVVLEVAEHRALMLKKAENLIHRLIIEGHDIERDESLIDALATALDDGKSEKELYDDILSALEKNHSLNRIRKAILR